MARERSVKLGFSGAFQIKYCLVIIAIFSGASALLYLLLNRTLSGSYLENLRILYFMQQKLPFYLGTLALLQLLFLLILTLVITLLVSHQIAGPVFRYEAVFRQMLVGEFPKRVATRKNDQLKIILDPLNTLNERCHNCFAAAHKLAEQLATGPPGAKEKRQELLRQVEEVRRTLDEDSGSGTSA